MKAIAWFTRSVASLAVCTGCSGVPKQNPSESGFGGNLATGGVGAAAGAGMGGGTAGNAGTSARTFSYTPTAVPKSSDELTNPLRGQYLWLGEPGYPAGWPVVDSYQRYEWVQFEPSHGNYNWSLIDGELTRARSRHGRFGMRIMPLCQDCATHTYAGASSSIPDDLAAATNPLIASPPGGTGTYLLPDWNSEAYLSRVEELLNAIGTRYKDDPTFAFFDVSSYGNWGEFHLWPFSQSGGPYANSTQRPITDANARRIVNANAAAFPNKIIVINSENPAALAQAVASTTPPIGIRVDCLGSDGLAGGQSAIDAVPGATDRWRTAPFITEWCQYNLGSSGANLFVQGSSQVTQFHVSMLSSDNFTSNPATSAEITAFRSANVNAGYRLRVANATVTTGTPNALNVDLQWVNDNVAPTYLAWKAVLVLRGTSTIELPLVVDLRKVMPDSPLEDIETLQSASVPAGTYDLLLRVDDAQSISPPMNLAMQGRDTNGNYLLGSLQVP